MNYDKYKNTLPYPAKPLHPKLPNTNPTPSQIIKYQDECATYDVKAQEYAHALDCYMEEATRVEAYFWKDAAEELGIPLDHPKLGRMEGWAYEHGHSGGYGDIFCKLSQAWELIKD